MSSTLWDRVALNLPWMATHDEQKRSPQVRHLEEAMSFRQDSQVWSLLTSSSNSTSAFITTSVGKLSTISSTLQLPCCCGSTIGARHKGHCASRWDFNHDTTHFLQTKCPHGMSFGSVNGSWQILHSVSDTGEAAVAMVQGSGSRL